MDAAMAKILAKMESQNKQKAAAAQAAAQNSPPKKKGYTVKEVLKHNKKNDFWIILDSKVYNVTRFYSDHPGGSAVLLNFLGTGVDAKNDFEDADHSKKARN